ncbi:hypothetical protein CsatB_016759 [Cannabis sativa]
MKIQIVLCFTVALALIFASGTNAATVNIQNNCGRTIWPATQSGSDSSQLSTTGFELASGASQSVEIPAGPWSGRFWGRDGCSTDSSGRFACASGDCASGTVECNGAGGVPPTTLVEITVAENGGQDFYDVSNVDGFNLPVSVRPEGGNGDCQESTCPNNLNDGCPADLQYKSGDDVVGCLSGCARYNTDQYCCRGDYDTEATCPPTDASNYFEQQCPQAYSYAYDDRNSLFTCFGGPNYLITFCP